MNKEKQTLKFREVFGFGTAGMFTYGFQLCVTGYYLMYFMTDVIGFSTALAATLYTAIQWVKMGTMATSGLIIDAVNFKGGKYRTWTLIAGIALGITFPLTFTYFELPTSVHVIVFLVFYSLMTLSYNVGWTSMRALIGKMSKNKSDVVSLNIAAQVGGTASGVLYGYIGYAILGIGLWAGTKQEYAGASTIYGAAIIVGAIYLYFMSRRYESVAAEKTASAQKKDKIGFLQMIKTLKGPMIPFFVSMSFSAAQAGFFSTLLVYYTANVLNDASASALALSFVSAAALIGSFLVAPLAKRFSKKSIHMCAQGLSAVLYVLLAVFGGTATGFIGLRTLISFIGTATSVLMSAICNDIGDHIEMQGHSAPRAFLQSMAGTTTRVGMIISSAAASFGLAIIGYKPGVTFDSGMITKLTALIAIGPAIVCVISVAAMFFYRIDEKEISEYNKSRFSS